MYNENQVSLVPTILFVNRRFLIDENLAHWLYELYQFYTYLIIPCRYVYTLYSHITESFT